MSKLLFIVNPVTAKNTITPCMIDVIDTFIKGGYRVETHITQDKDDVGRVIAEHGSEFDVIACAGGDGTLNNTVTAILKLDKKPKIGYIPAGTTNDFATSWGIPKKPVAAAMSIVKTEAVPTDVSVFCGRPFVYVAAFGVFTQASYQTPQHLKNSLGYTAYIFEGIKSIANIRPHRMRIEYDGGVAEGEFLYGMLSNTRRVGGFDLKMKDNISISDGLMEVILIRKPANPVDNPKMLGAVLAQDTNSEYIVFAHTKKIKFYSDESVLWTIDGENGGSIKSGEAHIIEHAVNLFF